MEYQKTINLIDDTPNQPSRFRTKGWIETNHNLWGTNNINNQVKFKTKIMIKNQVYVIIVMRTYLLEEQ